MDGKHPMYRYDAALLSRMCCYLDSILPKLLKVSIQSFRDARERSKEENSQPRISGGKMFDHVDQLCPIILFASSLFFYSFDAEFLSTSRHYHILFSFLQISHWQDVEHNIDTRQIYDRKDINSIPHLLHRSSRGLVSSSQASSLQSPGYVDMLHNVFQLR